MRVVHTFSGASRDGAALIAQQPINTRCFFPRCSNLHRFRRMIMLTRSLFLTVTLVSLVAGRAFAQAPIANPLGDKVSLAAAFGGFSGAADLGTSAQGKLGGAGSVDAPHWVQPHMG